jgi:hypothetical protein
MRSTWGGRSIAYWAFGLALLSVRATAESSMKPPGDCTKEEHRQLKRAVGEACKSTGMKCTEHDDCDTLWKKLIQGSECIAARQRIADKCFRGGDGAHLDEIANYRKGTELCRRYLAAKNCPQDPCKCVEPVHGRRPSRSRRHEGAN